MTYSSPTSRQVNCLPLTADVVCKAGLDGSPEKGLVAGRLSHSDKMGLTDTRTVEEYRTNIDGGENNGPVIRVIAKLDKESIEVWRSDQSDEIASYHYGSGSVHFDQRTALRKAKEYALGYKAGMEDASNS
jgi:hypothetical protein